MLRSIALSSAALFAFLPLMACSNTTPLNETPQSSDVSEVEKISDAAAPSYITQQQADNFTTQGKATKRRDTPDGPVQIYDIAQDAEVARAIEELYAQGHLTFGDVTHRHSDVYREPFFSPDIDVSPAAELVMKARQIAYLDLFRTGCKRAERSPCGLGNSSFRTDYFQEKPCTNCNLGKPLDQSTEALAGNYARVAELRLTEDMLEKGRWPLGATGAGDSVLINECKEASGQILLPYLYIGERSGYSLEETKTILFHHECGDE